MKITPLAKQLAHLLAERKLRVVFAESCTAGLLSAMLSRTPGISQWHCGSAVTYRNETKTQWLDVRGADIRRHSAVSEQVARQMAYGVLAKTPEAQLSASITGHLGPDAPKNLDGIVYIAIALRRGTKPKLLQLDRLKLTAATRFQRQREAVGLVLKSLIDSIQ